MTTNPPLRKWGSRKADRDWTAAVLARYGRICWLQLDGCLTVATTGDHLIPRSVRPDLEHDVTNGRPACLPCNRRRKARPAPAVNTTVDIYGILSVDPFRLTTLDFRSDNAE